MPIGRYCGYLIKEAEHKRSSDLLRMQAIEVLYRAAGQLFMSS